MLWNILIASLGAFAGGWMGSRFVIPSLAASGLIVPNPNALGGDDAVEAVCTGTGAYVALRYLGKRKK